MKTVSRILMTLTLVLFLSGITIAQKEATVKTDPKTTQTVKTTPGKFVDANKNGVCDNFEARGQATKGANFIDKNGDGVCDNRGTMGKGQGKGNGCGQGFRHRHGKGNGNCCGRGQGSGRGNGPGNPVK